MYINARNMDVSDLGKVINLNKKYYYLPDIVGKGYKRFWKLQRKIQSCKKEVVLPRNPRQQSFGTFTT